jgi:class 3 adenylate cyclase
MQLDRNANGGPVGILDELDHTGGRWWDAHHVNVRVNTEQRRLATVVDGLRRFVSPPLADLILRGRQDKLRSHRCEVSVVFLDLRGFTSFTESVEPDHVMFVLRGYHEAVGRLVTQYGGMLERFTGDGIMVYFNDPVRVPDPQWRAVSFAKAAHERVAALGSKWERPGARLALGVGISHGFATVGLIGFEGRYDYAAIGGVTNLAARLCAQARDGETLVCQKVMSAVGHAVEAETIGHLQLRGFHQAYEAFCIKSLKAA